MVCPAYTITGLAIGFEKAGENEKVCMHFTTFSNKEVTLPWDVFVTFPKDSFHIICSYKDKNSQHLRVIYIFD